MKALLFLVGWIAVSAVASTAQADLINGGFEQGATGWQTSNFETEIGTPSQISAIVNVVSKSGVAHSPFAGVYNDATGGDHGFIQPNTGGYYAALNNDGNGNGPAVLSQAVATVAGDTYQLSFALNALPQQANQTNNILFNAYEGSAAPTFHLDNSVAPSGWVFDPKLGGGNFYTSTLTPVFSLRGGTSGWTTETVTFVATSGLTTIAFAGINDPRYTGLDDVSLRDISGTPLPGNLTMCGITAVVGCFGYRYRRKLPVPA